RDEIAQQVVTGRVRLLSLADQLATARQSLSDAQENLRLDQERKEFGVGIVLETIVTEQELTRARTDYLRIVAEYNKVQYDLLRALVQISMDFTASRVTRPHGSRISPRRAPTGRSCAGLNVQVHAIVTSPTSVRNNRFLAFIAFYCTRIESLTPTRRNKC